MTSRAWCWPVLGLLAFSGVVGARAETPPADAEGFPNYSPGPTLGADAAPVQPGRVEPSTICAGGEVTLLPPVGRTFPEADARSRVLFAPCGIPGSIVEWGPTAIRVIVPDEARTGPVWLALNVNRRCSTQLKRGPACLRSLAEHDVVPERLGTACDAAVGDPLDPAGPTRLRGIPASDASPDGQPAERAGERAENEPPACRVMGPDRRQPITFRGKGRRPPRQGQGPRGAFDIETAGDPSGSCFETCEEVYAPKNDLVVLHPPAIDRFLPAVSELRQARVHRVERGMNRVSWQVMEGAGAAALRLSRPGAAEEPVAWEGEITLDIQEGTDLRLKGTNACGVREVNLFLEPATTLRVSPERLDLRAGTAGELRVVVDAPLPVDVPLALDNTSSGLFTLTPALATLPAGATELRVRVELSARAAALGADAQVGQVHVRVADRTSASAASVLDGREPARIHLLGGGAVGAPGPGEILVRGRLLYRECLSPNVGVLSAAPSGGPITTDPEGCALDGALPIVKPVRRARVEVWDQAPFPNVQRAVVETDDNGDFRALVPPSSRYDVTVVASSFAGQVDLENNAITWFWKDLRMPQSGAGGSTLTFDTTFGKRDAQHFNALDGITRGLEYALDRSDLPSSVADPVFRKTVVIPGGGVMGGNTHRVGNATHIWINSGAEIWEDETVLHEYGHHMQHANGTYQVWGTLHDGCYASVVAGPACMGRRRARGETDTAPDRGCWVNSPELAWFEGFPAYFSRVVMDFDDGHAFTRSTRYPFAFAPGPGTSCPLVTTAHFNHHNALITGASVEHHVAGALRALGDRGDVLDPFGAPLGRPDIEKAAFQVFFNDLRDRAPTVFGFRDAWAMRFPGNASWLDLMAFFGM